MLDELIHVRVARYDEAEIICKLVHESMAHYCRDAGIPNDYIEATTEAVDVVRDAIASGVVFVALNEEEKILGTCRLYIRPKREFSSALPGSSGKYSSRIAYFARFSVWDEWRSKGIGNFLLSYCEKIAIQTGCSHILLHTAISNKNMVQYYQTRGFEIISSDQSRGYDRGLFSKKLK
ncbi:MAG: GNAT family N-acetyltransferase [Clostridiales bacterium]|nr:GNAT family N-acetyltransferase [Clostridiales bacterium]